MDDAAIRHAEQRVWAAILEAAPGCDSVEVCDPWRKRSPMPFQVPVSRDGRGLLSWLPATRRKALRSVASGPVQGDRVQLILIQTATSSVPLNLRLMVRSHWSRRGVPMTQAMAYPEGIVLSRDEAEAVLATETDYRCLWFVKDGKASVLCTFNAEEFSESEVLDLARQLRDPQFQARYSTVGALKGNFPRYTRRYPLTGTPPSRFLIVHQQKDPLLIMARPYTRLFQAHRVLEILNLDNPITELIKEAG